MLLARTIRGTILLSALALLGCSTGRNYDQDREAKTIPNNATVVKLPGVPNAVYDVGGIASAVAHSPSYYKNTSVRGTISRVGPNEKIGSPCAQCAFSLACSIPGRAVDLIVRGQTDNAGKFSTLVKPDQMCEIVPLSDRYKIHPDSPWRLTPGLEHSILFLSTPREKKKLPPQE